VQGSYVGRLSRHNLVQRDLAMPTNLRDPKSGQTYYQAMTQLATLLDLQGVKIADLPKIPFFENLWAKAGGNGFITFAEQWVASGIAALAVATMPLFAALIAGLWGRWPRKMEWVGLLLGFTGVILLNLEGDMRANPIGAIALLVGAASWALGSVWSRYLPLPGGMMASATEMLGGGAVLLVLGLVSGERMTAFPAAGPTLAFFYLVVFGSIVAFSAYSYLLQKVRPTLSTSYAYVNPVVAVALGVWLGGELITWAGLVAMPIILLGVGIVMLSKERKTGAVNS